MRQPRSQASQSAIRGLGLSGHLWKEMLFIKERGEDPLQFEQLMDTIRSSVFTCNTSNQEERQANKAHAADAQTGAHG